MNQAIKQAKKTKITHQQEQFCLAYANCLNASASARKAGYSLNTANITASKLLKKPHISARIEQLLIEKAERENLTGKEVIQALRDIAHNDETRVSDKIRALELLGKHLKLWSETVDHKHAIDIQFQPVLHAPMGTEKLASGIKERD